MSKEFALLKEFKRGTYNAAVLCSYNVYFPFFENVLLPAMRTQECQHVVVFMDARQLGRCLQDQELSPRLAGRHYTLIPVHVPGAFHPKLVLLVGKRATRVMVGSHNLTLSGFGQNHEVTNVTIVEKGKQGRAFAQAALAFAMECAADSGTLIEEFLGALNQWAPWLSEVDEGTDDSVLLATSPNGATLWEKLAPLLEGLDVSRIVATGPYFDEKLALLRLLETRFPEARVVVGIDPEGAELEPDARAQLQRTRFVDLSTWSARGNHPFSHAKVLWFQTKSAGSLLVSGSANLSAPAWLAQSSARNTELVVVRRLEIDSTVPSDLGLPAVLDLPEVASESWERISRRRGAEPSAGTGTRAWAATLTRAGLEVDATFLQGATALRVLDATGELLAELDLSGGIRHLLDDIPEAAFLEAIVDGRSRRAVVLRLDELRERSSGKSRQDLRQALGQFPTAGLELEALFSIIEKAIGSESAAPLPGPTGGHSSQAKAAGGGGVVVGEIQQRRKNRRSVATGDIALVLDALIRRVSEGLLQDYGVDERVSEEALKIAGDQAAEREPPDLNEAGALAQRCRAKTKRLMDRLGRALRQRAESDEDGDPYLSIMQFTAALGLLHQVRWLEGRLDWLPKGESLVDDGAIETALEVGALWVFAPEGGLAASFANRYGDSSELASCRLLCCWLAYLNGVDVLYAFGQPRHSEGARGVAG